MPMINVAMLPLRNEPIENSRTSINAVVGCAGSMVRVSATCRRTKVARATADNTSATNTGDTARFQRMPNTSKGSVLRIHP